MNIIANFLNTSASKNTTPVWACYPPFPYKEVPSKGGSATYYQQPPLLSCGYGVVPVCPTPVESMDQHEKTIRAYLETLRGSDIISQIKAAKNHELFGKFAKSINRKFGSLEDLIEFEMWLAKMKISDSELSPDKTAYKEWWGKFKKDRNENNSLSTPPSSAASSPPPVTPECRKTLDLEGLLGYFFSRLETVLNCKLF